MTPTQKIENSPLVAGDGFKQIGSTLKAARVSEGLSVRDISEKLRISVDFLTKLEAGAFNELPAPAYVIGFLRSYGRCVGLAPDLLVARYMAVTEGEGSKPNYQTPMSTRPPQRSAPAVASMLVLFALMVYGGWFWLKTNSLSVPNSVETDTKTAVLSRSSDHGGTAIGVASLDQPAKIDPVVDNSVDTSNVSTAISSTEKTTKPSGPGLYTHKKQVTDKLEPELAPNDKTALESAEIGSSVVQAGISGQANTDLTLGETQILSLPKTETSSRVLPDELVKTQMLKRKSWAIIKFLGHEL